MEKWNQKFVKSNVRSEVNNIGEIIRRWYTDVLCSVCIHEHAKVFFYTYCKKTIIVFYVLCPCGFCWEVISVGLLVFVIQSFFNSLKVNLRYSMFYIRPVRGCIRIRSRPRHFKCPNLLPCSGKRTIGVSSMWC